MSEPKFMLMLQACKIMFTSLKTITCKHFDLMNKITKKQTTERFQLIALIQVI